MSDTLTEAIVSTLDLHGVAARHVRMGGGKARGNGIVWARLGPVVVHPEGDTGSAQLDTLEAIVAKLTDEITRLRAEA